MATLPFSPVLYTVSYDFFSYFIAFLNIGKKKLKHQPDFMSDTYLPLDPACLRALPQGATVLLLGGRDTGKTTWMQDMALALAGEGKVVGLLDCDLGQSEIGPPGTIGTALAVPGNSWRSLRDLAPLAEYFVGATSPTRHFLEVCAGAVQMARVARKRRPDVLLVDTDGLIAGPAAHTYKQHLAELLLPQAIVALARGEELEPILRAFAHRDTPFLWRVAVSEAVRRKTTAVRTTRRAGRFLAALESSQPLTFSLDEVMLQGTGLGLGTALPHHLLLFLGQSLRRPVLHAEQTTEGLYVVTHGDGWDPAGLGAVESFFSTRSVTIVAAQKFAQLLVGLIAPSGALLGLGRIERIDFARRTLIVQSPCRKPRAVILIRFGSLRLSADGRELGEVRPGEL